MSIPTLFDKMEPQYYPTMSELACLVHHTRPQWEEGWLFLHANNNYKMVENVPNNIKNWNDKFLFVGGDWRSPASASDPSAHLDIQTNFGKFRR